LVGLIGSHLSSQLCCSTLSDPSLVITRTSDAHAWSRFRFGKERRQGRDSLSLENYGSSRLIEEFHLNNNNNNGNQLARGCALSTVRRNSPPNCPTSLLFRLPCCHLPRRTIGARLSSASPAHQLSPTAAINVHSTIFSDSLVSLPPQAASASPLASPGTRLASHHSPRTWLSSLDLPVLSRHRRPRRPPLIVRKGGFANR
jgi:hypothetical protein